jgi:hypothetical protein
MGMRRGRDNADMVASNESPAERDRGIKAIIGLQAAVGIEETPEQAAAGWDRMTDSAKRRTMLAAGVVLGPDWYKEQKSG